MAAFNSPSCTEALPEFRTGVTAQASTPEEQIMRSNQDTVRERESERKSQSESRLVFCTSNGRVFNLFLEALMNIFI